MTQSDCDILISGGGIAGLTAAAAFGTAGFNVVCVDPAAPVTDRDDLRADMRSTAMLQPARALLEAAGWRKIDIAQHNAIQVALFPTELPARTIGKTLVDQIRSRTIGTRLGAGGQVEAHHCHA